MKIALAQLNTTVGAFERNVEKIISTAQNAAKSGCDLCVFSEMGITGYPPHDLLERNEFIARSEVMLEKICHATLGLGAMGVVLGSILLSETKEGKPLQNCAVLLHEGQQVFSQAKSLLPTYDVFDERRYFEPALTVCPVLFKGVRLGLTVCEDIWHIPGERVYDVDPVAELVAQGAEIIINVSASPFTLEKGMQRQRHIMDLAKRHGRPVIFVNQVGGNDDLIFDGHSMAVSAQGEIIQCAAGFCEDLVLVNLAEPRTFDDAPPPLLEQLAFDALVLGTRDYARKSGFTQALIGLSGGIDSALVAAVAAKALGPQNVYCVAMPTRYSSEASFVDARLLAATLGVHFERIGVDGVFGHFLDLLEPALCEVPSGVTRENLQARIRGVTLMALSNKFGYLLLTTGNKSEMATGYCTLYGDMAGGLSVLSDVPKTLVFRICEYLNRDGELIPRSIIDKPPSAELREDQKDEDSLPPYPVLDAILQRHIDEGQDYEAIVLAGFDENIVRDVLRLVKNSEYKRKQAPPGLKITSKAFGPGRRIPMVHSWKG